MEYDMEGIQVKTIHGTQNFCQKHVLEIGCGNGSTSVHLARGTKTYTAIDPDQEAIAQAKELGNGVKFKVGSGQALEFDNNCFDLVLFTLSLHHQDSQTALKEAFRVLVPGGSLLVLEPVAKGEFQQFFHLFEDETPALDAALIAIQTSKFALLKREKFHVVAFFENTRDLLSYDFGRSRIRPEEDKKILDLLWEFKGNSFRNLKRSSTSQPGCAILLKDELQIFLLEKI